MMKLKLVAVLVTVATMSFGCANADYARYVSSQTDIQVAKSNAEAAKYNAMAAVASSGDTTTKVAAMFAMSTANSGNGNNQTNIAPPKSPWEIAREWAALLVPAAVQGYSIVANRDVAITQSNNSRDVAVSTNSTFSTMNTSSVTALQSLGASGLTAATSLGSSGFTANTAISKDGFAAATTISKDGFAAATNIAGEIQAPGATTTTTTTTTSTLSGTGVLGTGSFTNTETP